MTETRRLKIVCCNFYPNNFTKLCWRRQNCTSLWFHQFWKKAKSSQLLQVHTNLTKSTILVHLKKTIVQFTMKPWIVWLTHWKKEKSEEEYHPSSPKENYRKIYYEALDWLYVLAMSRTRFRVNPHSIFAWMSRNSFLEADAKSEV